jgi:hypothetical protein
MCHEFRRLVLFAFYANILDSLNPEGDLVENTAAFTSIRTYHDIYDAVVPDGIEADMWDYLGGRSYGASYKTLLLFALYRGTAHLMSFGDVLAGEWNNLVLASGVLSNWD